LCVLDDKFTTRLIVGTLKEKMIMLHWWCWDSWRGIYFWDMCCVKNQLWKSDVKMHIIVLCDVRKNNYGGKM